jgi:hypothetical protein
MYLGGGSGGGARSSSLSGYLLGIPLAIEPGPMLIEGATGRLLSLYCSNENELGSLYISVPPPGSLEYPGIAILTLFFFFFVTFFACASFVPRISCARDGKVYSTATIQWSTCHYGRLLLGQLNQDLAGGGYLVRRPFERFRRQHEEAAHKKSRVSLDWFL